ncbi:MULTISPECIES: hypothetical protein [unclassified Amycolatopsis]|uniref:hypothetical protein n=1 Tax=unclassified Amycolatopsis TaxID=2618356 RepID=UPI001C694FB6|nr:hypothetical protein [Amycolatopsis sp. DSM 110486]QYN19228.1 hypothetical protein K1T34_42415 [Amycolatopsis sp. DSM 110486]
MEPLAPGDASQIRGSTVHLTVYGDTMIRTGEGVQRLDIGDWEGSACDPGTRRDSLGEHRTPAAQQNRTLAGSPSDFGKLTRTPPFEERACAGGRIQHPGKFFPDPEASAATRTRT